MNLSCLMCIYDDKVLLKIYIECDFFQDTISLDYPTHFDHNIMIFYCSVNKYANYPQNNCVLMNIYIHVYTLY